MTPALNKNNFWALSDTEVVVLGNDSKLWLWHGPFNGTQSRQQVDSSVLAFQALSDTEIFVLGGDAKLWLEYLGNNPLPRQQVDQSVATLFPPSPNGLVYAQYENNDGSDEVVSSPSSALTMVSTVQTVTTVTTEAAGVETSVGVVLEVVIVLT